MPLLDPTPLATCQVPEHGPQVFPERRKQRRPPILRDKDAVLFAFPECVLEALVVRHGGFLSVVPWAAQRGSHPFPPTSNAGSHPSRAGGLPQWS